MSKFPITINATKIFDRKITIPGVPTSDWRDPPPDPDHPNWHDARMEQLVQLAPGTHGIGVPSCISEVKFEVTPTGTVTFEKRFEGCLEVSGGNRLTVTGRSVTLDARYVAMAGAAGVLPGAGGLGPDDWIAHRMIHLLPGSHYHVQQGSAMVSSFIFRIRDDGRFDYDPSHDLSKGGFLGGLGTSTLVFRGYPFLLDATQVGEQVFFDAHGQKSARNGVQFANLLPMQIPFLITFIGGSVTQTDRLGVIVHPDGTSKLEPPGTACKVTLDSFHGVPRLTIAKR